MGKVRKIVSVMVMVIVVSSLSGFSFKAQAATDSNDYLPKGWTSLGLNDLTDKQKNIVQAPAPGLTSLQIIDLALDEKNEIHVVTKEIGTSRSSFVWVNGGLCSENINEEQLLVGADRIVYGYIKYFHTGITYSDDVSGRTLQVKAESHNAMQPWNTLSASRNFVIP